MARSVAKSAMVTFGDLLRQLRKRSGMTQADLAAAVGYSVPFISNLELNQRLPDVQVVLQHFVPALTLQEEPQLAARLVELAAAARGERPPEAVTTKGDLSHLLSQEISARSTLLPLPPTALLGRAEEVERICNRLLAHNGRLMTLIGPPGIGKTRLALAVAEKMRAIYREGAYFVPLSMIEDADLVAPAIGVALGIGATDERPPSARVIDFLRRKELLLLLDNFEQIIDAATLVAEIVANCPGVCVLVTSRERLHLRAEQRYRVIPLEIGHAVDLFVQRAQAVDENFVQTPSNRPTLVEICRHLDCLPLAIELSAARIDLFGPEMLLARLLDRRLDLLGDGPRDLPAHQRTLRNAIHRSYDLLDEEEKPLFRSLAVFAGGFESEAVAEICGAETTLQSLVNKSLVQMAARADGTPRFLLLETLREYAREQLEAANEVASIQLAHATYFLQLAEAATAHFRSPTQTQWLDRLTLEQANLRAALAWAISARESELAVRLGMALWRFWQARGHFEEGEQWLAQLLALPCEAKERAQLLYGRGMLARLRGDLALATESLTASLALFRSLEELRGVASSLRGLAFIHYLHHDRAVALPILDEALELFRRLGDLEGVAVTLDSIGYISNDLEEMQQVFSESLALRRSTGNLRGITMSLAGLAGCAIHKEEYAVARAYLQEHLTTSERLGNQNGVARALFMLATVATGEGDLPEALALFNKCLNLCRTTGDRLLLPGTLQRVSLTQLLSGEGEAVVAENVQAALLLYQEQGNVLGLAETLTMLACLASQQGFAERALTVAGAAEANCSSLNSRLVPAHRRAYARAVADARQQLGAEAAAAWTAGQAMNLAQAVAYALADPP